MAKAVCRGKSFPNGYLPMAAPYSARPNEKISLGSSNRSPGPARARHYRSVPRNAPVLTDVASVETLPAAQSQRDLHVTVRPDHDVFRLDVTMNNTGCVCSGERLGDLKPEIGKFRRGRACAQTLSQSDAVDEFHYNHRRRPIRYDFINGDNVGMVQGRSSAGLFKKSRRARRPIAPAVETSGRPSGPDWNREPPKPHPFPHGRANGRPRIGRYEFRPLCRINGTRRCRPATRVTGGRDQIEQNFRIERGRFRRP